jgi:hypothetical protein
LRFIPAFEGFVTRAALISLAFLLALAAPAAAAPLKLGIGEQNPEFFDDPRWQRLDAPYVRYAVAWDALRSKWQTEELDRWMTAARRARAKILVTFSHSRGRRELYLPTRAQFTRQFRALRRRYPFLRTFQTWNEANHGTQPTFRRPGRAARYYDAIRRNCPECTVSAPAVLDAPNMVSWITRFRKKARFPVRIWSIHNHIDANRHRTSGTRTFLKITKGQVWFTETGGITNRWIDGKRRRHYNRKNAARAVRNVFKLARLSRRVTRVYFYHWLAPPERRPRWDSGLVDRHGNARPSLKALTREARRRAR